MKQKELFMIRQLSLAALSFLMMISSALPASAMQAHDDEHIHDESCFIDHSDHDHEHVDENGNTEAVFKESENQAVNTFADESIAEENTKEGSQPDLNASAEADREESNKRSDTEEETEAFSSNTQEEPVVHTEFYFNELHEDSSTEEQRQEMEAMLVTEDDSSWTYQAPTVNQEKPVYTTMENAAAQMRQYMVERQEKFTLYVNEPYVGQEGTSPSSATQLFQLASEHTGNPLEGDYLAWHFEKWTVSIGKYVQSGKFTAQYTVSYYTTPQEEAEVSRTLENLMAEMPFDSKNVHQSIFNAYSWITDHVRYDNAAAADKNSNLHAFTAYGALIDHKAVCQGYAILFYRWMLENGINCRFISGTASNQAHGWNIVQLDCQWYHADATWDEGDTTYDYFLRGTQNFKNHTRDARFTTAEFLEAYPVGTADYAEFSYSLYGKPEWNEDKTKIYLTAAGPDGGKPLVKSFNASPVKEESNFPTCTNPGRVTYQSSGYYMGEWFDEVLTEYEPVLGHNLTKTIVWNGDNQAEVTFICLNGCGIPETVPADVAELKDEYMEPDCKKDGQRVLQAKAALKDERGNVLDTFEDTRIIVLPKLPGHVYEAGICIYCGDLLNPFPDINMNTWVAEHALNASARGLMTGLADGTFNPYGHVTRGQVLVILYRMADQPSVNSRKIFTDVNPDAPGHYFADAVTWAYDNGIAKGYEPAASGTRFGPSDPVTRQQLAAFLFNFAGYMNLDVTARADLNTFPDANRVSDYGKEPMAWLTGEGMVQGVLIDNEWYLAPFNTSNRAQMAKLAVLMDERLDNLD